MAEAQSEAAEKLPARGERRKPIPNIPPRFQRKVSHKSSGGVPVHFDPCSGIHCYVLHSLWGAPRSRRHQHELVRFCLGSTFKEMGVRWEEDRIGAHAIWVSQRVLKGELKRGRTRGAQDKNKTYGKSYIQSVHCTMFCIIESWKILSKSNVFCVHNPIETCFLLRILWNIEYNEVHISWKLFVDLAFCRSLPRHRLFPNSRIIYFAITLRCFPISLTSTLLCPSPFHSMTIVPNLPVCA